MLFMEGLAISGRDASRGLDWRTKLADVNPLSGRTIRAIAEPGNGVPVRGNGHLAKTMHSLQSGG